MKFQSAPFCALSGHGSAPHRKTVSRLSSFLLHVLEARCWSYAAAEFQYPAAFARVLNADAHESRTGCRLAEAFWEALLHAECESQRCTGLRDLRRQVHWASFPAVQLGFRLLADADFQVDVYGVLSFSTCHAEIRSSSFDDPLAGWVEACILQVDERVREHLAREFTRIGDTKCVEESFKLTRAMETRDQDRRTLTVLRIFELLAGGAATPLDWRQLPHVALSDEVFFQGSQADAKPRRPWAELFEPTSTKLPPALHCKRVFAKKKTYQSPTPKAGCKAIAAGQALVFLRERSLSDQAHCAYQTVVLVPHAVVRQVSSTGHGGDSCYLVLACGTFAARVWRLVEVGACLQADPRVGWEWITVVDAKEWQHVPTECVTHAAGSASFGFLAWRQTSAPVPAVIQAMLVSGHRRLLRMHRTWLVKFYGVASERDLFALLLSGHQDQEWYETQLATTQLAPRRKQRRDTKGEDDDAGDSDTESGSCDESEDEFAWLTGAALEEIPDRMEFKEQRRRHNMPDLVKKKLEAAKSKLTDASDRPQAPAGDRPQAPAPPHSQLAPADTAAAEPPADDTAGPHRRPQSRIAWVKRFLPGHPGSGTELPAEILRAELNQDRVAQSEQLQWFARPQCLVIILLT